MRHSRYGIDEILPSNYYRSQDAEKDGEIRKPIRDLIAYLNHCNKPDHVKTVMGLIDGNSRMEASLSFLMEDRNRNNLSVEAGRDEYGNPVPPSPVQTIELPVGTRKVSIEL